MEKIVVAQQIFCPGIASGPTTEFNLLLNNIPKEKFEIIPVVYSRVKRIFDFRATAFYKKKFKSLNPDIVVIRGASIDAFYAVRGARKAGCKCIITGIHGFYSDSKNYSRIKRFISRHIIEKTIIRKSNFFYTVSNRCYREHKWLGRYKAKYYGNIHNPYPKVEIKKKLETREKTRQALGIPINAPVGLYIGRITEDKGVIELCLSIKAAIEERDFYFIFAGDGNCKEKCETILKDLVGLHKVFYVGPQTNVGNYYFSSDFFVFPSKHENHPFSILEACAFGNYCLATDVGDIFETIEEGLNGEKLESSNPLEIKNHIIGILDNGKYKTDFLEKWLAIKKETMSLDAFINKTTDMYMKCYEKKK